MVTESVLAHPWALWLAVAVLLAGGVAGYLTRRGVRPPSSVRWVANASYLTELASFRSRLAIYKVGIATLCGLALVGGVAAGVVLARPIDRQVQNSELATRDLVLARPIDRQVQNSELATRDLVLCLDVSGSMVGYDAEIVDRFLALVENFQGERIALSIWNQTSRTVFPLTDDYSLVTEELEAARDALDFDVTSLDDGSYDPAALDRLLAFITGTEGGDENSTSLIGDGLASCSLLFDEADTERSRSIILASDNQLIGTPIFQLGEAAELVTSKEIALIGIYSGAVTDTSSAEQKEFESVVREQDGLYFEAADPSAVDAIIDRIQSQQAVDLDATPEVVVTDRPGTALAVLAGAFAVLAVLVWRLRT